MRGGVALLYGGGKISRAGRRTHIGEQIARFDVVRTETVLGVEIALDVGDVKIVVNFFEGLAVGIQPDLFAVFFKNGVPQRAGGGKEEICIGVPPEKRLTAVVSARPEIIFLRRRCDPFHGGEILEADLRLFGGRLVIVLGKNVPIGFIHHKQFGGFCSGNQFQPAVYVALGKEIIDV